MHQPNASANIKEGLIEAGRILDSQFFTPKTAYETADKSSELLRDIGVKEGLIAIIKKKRYYDGFRKQQREP
jgi:hypothetical protein